MTEANVERGEHELELAGTTYRLRPSFEAMMAIERKTERSLLELVRLGNLGALSLETLGIVASELIRAGAESALGKRVSAERIAQLIYERGLPAVMARVTLALLAAANGGCTLSGEARAPAA